MFLSHTNGNYDMQLDDSSQFQLNLNQNDSYIFCNDTIEPATPEIPYPNFNLDMPINAKNGMKDQNGIKGVGELDYCFICRAYSCTCDLPIPQTHIDDDHQFRIQDIDCLQNNDNNEQGINLDKIDIVRQKIPETLDQSQSELKLKIPKADFEQSTLKQVAVKGCSPTKSESSISQVPNSVCNNTIEDSKMEEYTPTSRIIKKSKSKNDNNLFLVRRACFRGFSKYYTTLFSKSNYSWQRQRGNKKKKTSIMTLIREFAEQEFGNLIQSLTEEQWLKFRKSLMTILFSQRYKKGDEFLQGINFTGIRNVLYHYTTEARVDFLKDPQFCILYHHFYTKNREEFLESKVKEKCKLDMGELKQELAILDEECLLTLSKQDPFK